MDHQAPRLTDHIGSAVNTLNDVAARFEQTATAAMQAFAQSAQRMTAPKRVVRDAQGRVVGIETIDNG